MPVPDLADPRPPYLQIADELRRQINSGRYQPGDKLPSNKAMAADYRTSTETIRRALRALMDEGLVGAHSTWERSCSGLPPNRNLTRTSSGCSQRSRTFCAVWARLRSG